MKTNMASFAFAKVKIVWFLLPIAGITAVIIQGPSNAVSKIGGQVKLTCIADIPINYWFLSKDGNPNDDLAIVGPGCSGANPPYDYHYTVESIGGGTTCNLIIFNIGMEQAGVYRCYDGQNQFFSILTVIENFPILSYNTTDNVVVENENVIITCSLNHNGSVSPAPTQRPYFVWEDYYGDNVNSSYSSTSENVALSQITVMAGREDIRSYTCRVYLLLIPPATENYADNVPVVDCYADSPIIDVLYGVTSVGYSIHNTEYRLIGGIYCEISIITCSSSGNPPASFEWIDTKENVIITNDAFFDLAEINRNYTCTATNTIRNVVYRASQFIFPYDNSIEENCRFPRNESTWISLIPAEDCGSGTCSCSNGNDRPMLLCNSDSYPKALYQWTGTDGSIIDSQVYQNAQTDEIYRCTAYFDQATSDYTGNLIFSTGTSEIHVQESHELTDSNNTDDIAAIVLVVLFCISFAVNITLLVIWVYKYLRAKQDRVNKTETVVPNCDMVDLSNRSSARSPYEELRRPDETQQQETFYEALASNPTKPTG